MFAVIGSPTIPLFDVPILLGADVQHGWFRSALGNGKSRSDRGSGVRCVSVVSRLEAGGECLDAVPVQFIDRWPSGQRHHYRLCGTNDFWAFAVCPLDVSRH